MAGYQCCGHCVNSPNGPCALAHVYPCDANDVPCPGKERK